LSNNLLDEWLVRPSLGKRAHVEQVGPGEALHIRELTMQVRGQNADDLRSPARPVLAVENLPANLPVQENELPIYGENRAHLGASDPLFQLFQEAVVAFRTRGEGAAHGTASF
jgi:hypothetical protein